MLIEKKIPFKYIFDKVKLDLFVSLLFILLIIGINKAVTIRLPLTIPALLGTAISLVLAFKLNQSYDRWWEARKIWGSIVNDSRSLVNQVQGFSSKKKIEKKSIKTIVLRQIAWCYALALSLRELDPLAKVKDYLSKDELEELKNHQNVPLKLINNHNRDFDELLNKDCINEYQQIQIDKTLVRLVASMGKAERIKSTVFPRTYRIFLRFFIYLFILTLAIALDNLEPWYEISLLLFIAFPFFLLNKTAHHMQDPFENKPTDTAMMTISKKIEINLKQLIGEEVEFPPEPEDFYVM